jgi:tetratricopeptide (TPR) repeat protein
MRFRLTVALTLTVVILPLFSQDSKKPTGQENLTPTSTTLDADLAAADKSYKESKFSDAARQYQAILAKNASVIPAQAGLIRSTLRDQKLDEALAIGLKLEAASPDAASVRAAVGEVRFRLGEMSEAEREFRKAIALDPKEVRAYLGLGELLDVFGMHRMAYDLLDKAHTIAPEVPRVMRLWLHTLPRNERISLLEKYLSLPQGEDPDQLRGLEHYLEYLKAIDGTAPHPCKLVRPVASTETPLEMLLVDAGHLKGWGLKVKLNDRTGKFLVDTGASGLLIGRSLAEKSGVVRISGNEIGGIGDRGTVSGYYGYVNLLQIGELEFHDCQVRVIESKNAADEDGLIGADVFRSYLVSLNFRESKMKLEPLPKRPDEQIAPAASLDTQGNNEPTAEKDKIDNADPNLEKSAEKPSGPPVRSLPKDRYIAPEMKTWTPVFRFGHELLVSTQVNDTPRMLFLLDTGAFANTFSKRLAEHLGKISRDDRMTVRGLNGSVNQVYRAENATLEFGGLRQKNQNTVTLDLSTISRHTGTEVSGILGFNMLNMLDLQIDYRDNLVNFNYDPTKLGLPSDKKKK